MPSVSKNKMPSPTSTKDGSGIQIASYSIPFPPDGHPAPPVPPNLQQYRHCIPVPAKYFIKWRHAINSEDDKWLTSEVMQYDWSGRQNHLYDVLRYYNRSNQGMNSGDTVQESSETWFVYNFSDGTYQGRSWQSKEVKPPKGGPAMVHLLKINMGRGSGDYSDGNFRALFSLSLEALDVVPFPTNDL